MSIPDFNPGCDRQVTRRGILLGAGASLLAAPAIVPIGSLMPVRRVLLPVERPHEGLVRRLMFQALYRDLKSGRMTTICNGAIVSEARARGIVAYAFKHGFLPPDASPTVLDLTRTTAAADGSQTRL